MNEIENLRQEAETLKNAIRVSAKAIANYLIIYYSLCGRHAAIRFIFSNFALCYDSARYNVLSILFYAFKFCRCVCIAIQKKFGAHLA